MKREAFDQSASSSVLGVSLALIPESDEDELDLIQSLATDGVLHKLAFLKRRINGRLDFPDEVQWQPDGGVKMRIIVQNQADPIDAYFWVVELDDGRRFAWWNLTHDRDSAVPWNE